MNKLFAFLAALALASTLAVGQNAVKAPKIARMPTAASWILVYEVRKSPDVQAPSTDVPTAQSDGELGKRRVVVTKGDGMRWEQSYWDNDKVTEAWYAKGLVMQQLPTWPEDQLLVQRSGGGGSAPDVSEGDFPELAWVAETNYKGLGNFKGREYHHFQGDDGEEVWVDPDSLRPVAARAGLGPLWTYDYPAVASVPLQMPKLFADRLVPFEKRQARYEETMRELELQKQSKR